MSNITLTRLIIETATPMAIHSGERETGFDNELARDANGLPYIPASAIAGVWGKVIEQELEQGAALRQQWFGHTNKDQALRSAISISNGYVLNSQGQTTRGLVCQHELKQDAILQWLLNSAPHHRDRVKINDRGVAQDGAKFDQILLPKGVRFSISLHWNNHYNTKLNLEQWQQLLTAWHSRAMAFGSSTRNGLGQIKVIAAETQTFDLYQNPQAAAQFQHSLLQGVDLNNKPAAPIKAATPPLIKLQLQALDNWRCGQGTQLLGHHSGEHSVNILTYSEPSIEWHQGKGHITKKPVLCGSSIKGIISHRVAYHWRRRNEKWADDMGEASHEQWQQRLTALGDLFGHADDTDHANSIAGCIVVDDSEIQYQHTVIRQHNSIDRFTGGVRQGALYSEELLYQPKFNLTLWFEPRPNQQPMDETLVEALLDALEDIQLGLLPIGAGSGRGASLVMPINESQFDRSAIKQRLMRQTQPSQQTLEQGEPA